MVGIPTSFTGEGNNGRVEPQYNDHLGTRGIVKSPVLELDIHSSWG